MTDEAWVAVGRVVRERRLHLGMRKQEEIAEHGGPKKSTVGKIERGTMTAFPIATQQLMERALGWSRGTISDLHRSFERFGADDETIGDELIDAPPPDVLRVDSDSALREASDLALLSELGRRLATREKRTDDDTAPTTRAGSAGATVTNIQPDDDTLPDDVAADTGEPQEGFDTQEPG